MPENTLNNQELSRLAQNIAAWAHERGVTLRELAEQTGVPYAYLAQAEQGMIPDRITLLHLTAISQYFGRELHEMFG